MTGHSARLRTLALVLVGALAFAVAPATAAHAEGPGSVTVTVTADDSPALYTAVTLYGPDFAYGSTEQSGQVEFTDLALGDYTVLLPGTADHQEVRVDFSLTPEAPHSDQALAVVPWPTGSGSITGTVVDLASGEPLPGIAVRASRSGAPGQNLGTTSDAAGAFQLTGLVDAIYHIYIPLLTTHFSKPAEVEITSGGTQTIELALLAADSTITGRVVDPSGNGVPDVRLGALLMESEYGGGSYGQTDADGYYSLPGTAAGRWRVSVAADSAWELAVITVDVEAASTTTALDLVLTPRTTGTISGLVGTSDGIPESEIGGVFDVCVTVVEPDGTPVPDANTVTGGDSYYHFWLEPGDYTVFFEDCDLERQSHRYQSTYLGGSATLAGATIVTVETAVDLWLDTTYFEPQMNLPEPDQDARPVRTRDLQSADRDLVEVPSTLRRGETAEIHVGTEYTGQWVSAWLHSRPTQLGDWHQVSPEGTIVITVPRSHPLGMHELVVQDADDEVIGWTELRVRQRAK